MIKRFSIHVNQYRACCSERYVIALTTALWLLLTYGLPIKWSRSDMNPRYIDLWDLLHEIL